MQEFDYKIDKNEVLRYLGYRGQQIDGITDSRIDSMIELCLKTARPRYRYVHFDISETDEGIALIGTDTVFFGKDIASHLKGADSIALMAVTLGHECERKLLQLEAKSISDAVCFNSATIALTEEVADRCQSEIAEIYRKDGYFINARYSPGYGDFPLSQQKDVLKLLEAEVKLGITLTEGDLMLPRKSVTAVLGLFKEEQEHHTSCLSCVMRDSCQFRKSGEHCG
jgi:hypothetical protein